MMMIYHLILLEGEIYLERLDLVAFDYMDVRIQPCCI